MTSGNGVILKCFAVTPRQRTAHGIPLMSSLALDKAVAHSELVSFCNTRASVVEARAQEKAGESESVQDE